MSTAVAPTKEQLEKISSEFLAKTTGFSRLPNGDIRLSITVPCDVAMVLESQSDSAQEKFAEFLQKQVEEALQAFVMSTAG